jgi:hypothetical protein
MNDFVDRLLSRKFLSMCFGVAVAVGNAALGAITPLEAMTAIVALIAVYTGAEGAADFAGRLKPSMKTDPAPQPEPPDVPATN